MRFFFLLNIYINFPKPVSILKLTIPETFFSPEGDRGTRTKNVEDCQLTVKGVAFLVVPTTNICLHRSIFHNPLFNDPPALSSNYCLKQKLQMTAKHLLSYILS